MTVKCIWPGRDGLTEGDLYHVRGDSGLSIRIENDYGDWRYYPAEWFEVV